MSFFLRLLLSKYLNPAKSFQTRACVSHGLEAQGGKEDFGKGKGRKKDRKEGGRAAGKGKKERKIQ